MGDGVAGSGLEVRGLEVELRSIGLQWKIGDEGLEPVSTDTGRLSGPFTWLW